MTLSPRIFTVSESEYIDLTGRAGRRVIIHADVLKATKICAGDALALSEASNNADHRKPFSVGIAWPSTGIDQNGISFIGSSHSDFSSASSRQYSRNLKYSVAGITISPALLLTAGLSEGSRVKIQPLSTNAPVKSQHGMPSLRSVKEAGVVHMRELQPNSSTSRESVAGKSSNKGKRKDWLPLLVKESLVDLKYLTPTQTLEVTYEGQTRRFAATSVSRRRAGTDESVANLAQDLETLSIESSPQLWTVGWDTTVIIDDEKQPKGTAPVKPEVETLGKPIRKEDAYTSVGGLDKQIEQVRDLLEIPLTRPELFRHFGLKPPRGILLHGPPGTGKTHLARAIAASTSSSLIIINGPELSSAYHGETESKLRTVFAEARSKSPCIVVLDEVDALAPRRDEGPGGEVEKRVVATLLTIMDGMQNEDDAQGRVVVVATTNRPNAIDPALRRPGRFDREIEIGVPDAEARSSILRVLLSRTPHALSQSDIQTIASRAHGYVGADLSAVVREAGTLAIKRYLKSPTCPPSLSPSHPQLTLQDLLLSLPTVLPSALRSHHLPLPPLKFSSIGGLSGTIAKLRECVEWPLKYPDSFKRLGVRGVRGVLLYGPPGCAKTQVVRALAGESGVNFVAVRGPEVMSRFVGESERAIREVFSKARAASPSIVFFDEIDALATSRTFSSSNPTEGILTSLLNEMDGVQELVAVTVVGATNRPEVLDSALLRPGRLDRLLYLGPPDQAGREEILRIKLSNMAVGPEVDVEEIAKLTVGCSGAEITSMCQEAALITMRKDVEAPCVPQGAFIEAARSIKKQITKEIIAGYERWGAGSGATSV